MAASSLGPALAQHGWALMERHGGCVSLTEAAARKPEFRGVDGPDGLVAKLRSEGVAVRRQQIDADGSRAVLVDAPERGLNVVFVPLSACR